MSWLTDYELPALEMLAIYSATHRRTVKVKLFVDLIRKRFFGKPEWDEALSKIPSLTALLR